MIKVGVTGGIGSGKTTLCKVWEELGAFVVYADDFAKNLMTTDEELKASIKHTFGRDSYFKDGSLNRAYLAEEAFSKGRVKELNAIVHPVLWSRIADLSNQKEGEGVQVFVKEAAILLQNGRPKDLDYVILLDADESKRIDRVIKRDSINKDLVIDRINKQQSLDEVIHFADFVISNNSTEENLKRKSEELFQQIISTK